MGVVALLLRIFIVLLGSIYITCGFRFQCSSRCSSSSSTTPLRCTLNPHDLEEAELKAIFDLALGEEHDAELSRKVEASMQEDWDVEQGVVGFRRKALPLKMNLDMWNYYGKNAFLAGNFTEATEWYQRCIDYNPVDGRAWLGLAKVYQKKGLSNLAEKAYKDGLYYNPKNPFLMQAYSVMMDKSGKTSQALKMLTSSVKSNPWHAASWVELGRIHQKSGRIDEARFCFKSAVEGTALYWAGKLYM